MAMKFSPRELKLLANLRENGRCKLTEISKKSRIPVSTVFDMLQEMQENVITKNTVLIDFSKLGYHTRAQIFIRVEKQDKERLKNLLIFADNVNSIYRINGGWDFIIETVHRSIKELDDFLEDLGREVCIQEKEIHYLIEDIKREEFLSNGGKNGKC
ncbi:Lrp/AsnC family transcriptional regulator [Candidatus Woesearchaeota archaeon]|nr:Lrp/AsnC family transcriptional regulator [Candidatus Woesearchaeota archaeon]